MVCPVSEHDQGPYAGQQIGQVAKVMVPSAATYSFSDLGRLLLCARHELRPGWSGAENGAQARPGARAARGERSEPP